MADLAPAQRKLLKARAHALHPILQLGDKGLTDAVIAEIDRALSRHELIKVRAARLNREAREVALASICERTGAQPVQHIGKMLVVHRQKPPEEPPAPKPRLTRRAKTAGRDERKAARGRPLRRRRTASPSRPQRRRPLA
jgi:RNA-binding protein